MKIKQILTFGVVGASFLFSGCNYTKLIGPKEEQLVKPKKVIKNDNKDFVILKSIDIDYTYKQQAMFNTMIDYLDNYYYENAEDLLIKLVDSSEEVSYVVYYDMGVVKEAMGNYEGAERFYGVAKKYNVNRLKCIVEAYERVYKINQKNIEEKEDINNLKKLKEVCEITPSGVGVNIREKPKYHSKVVGTLNSYNKMNIIKEGSTSRWWKLEKTYNNTDAFVNKKVVKVLNCSKK
jgi:tetratricopeptide (TPR) repeat protein